MIEYLEALGSHINLRGKYHKKFVIIDDNILWEGSLNFLSWFDTEEHVRRFEDRYEVDRIIAKHNLLPCDGCAPPPSLAQIVFSMRVKLGLTQAEVAARAGTSRRIISEIENGSLSVSYDSAIRVLGSLTMENTWTPGYMAQRIRRATAKLLTK